MCKFELHTAFKNFAANFRHLETPLFVVFHRGKIMHWYFFNIMRFFSLSMLLSLNQLFLKTIIEKNKVCASYLLKTCTKNYQASHSSFFRLASLRMPNKFSVCTYITNQNDAVPAETIAKVEAGTDGESVIKRMS